MWKKAIEEGKEKEKKKKEEEEEEEEEEDNNMKVFAIRENWYLTVGLLNYREWKCLTDLHDKIMRQPEVDVVLKDDVFLTE